MKLCNTKYYEKYKIYRKSENNRPLRRYNRYFYYTYQKFVSFAMNFECICEREKFSDFNEKQKKTNEIFMKWKCFLYYKYSVVSLESSVV